MIWERTLSKIKNSVFHGPFAGRDMYITMMKDEEREFVVTHNADIIGCDLFMIIK